jgi:hypothetical protein
MRIATLLFCTLVSVIGFAGTQNALSTPNSTAAPLAEPDLSGSWTLRIENLSHKVIATMSIRFAAEEANSCLVGKWKRAFFSDQTSSAEHFFPLAEPLSYELIGDHIVIGRNEICDAYRQLDGKVSGAAASGDYVGVGLRGRRQLGNFSMTKSS